LGGNARHAAIADLEKDGRRFIGKYRETLQLGFETFQAIKNHVSKMGLIEATRGGGRVDGFRSIVHRHEILEKRGTKSRKPYTHTQISKSSTAKQQ